MAMQRLPPANPAALMGGFKTEVHLQRGCRLVSLFTREFGQVERALAAEQGMSVESLLRGSAAHRAGGLDGLVLQPFWSPRLPTRALPCRPWRNRVGASSRIPLRRAPATRCTARSTGPCTGGCGQSTGASAASPVILGERGGAPGVSPRSPATEPRLTPT